MGADHGNKIREVNDEVDVVVLLRRHLRKVKKFVDQIIR
jgi:predicted CoA-binding protein